MYVTGAFQRVYWVGVALALMADVELRRGSDNAISLDHVVLGLQACCAQQSRTWSSTEMLAQMDTLAGRPVFTELAQRHLDQADFPDVAATFAELGISIGADDAVLDPASTLAGVRTGIMAPVATKALAAAPANTTCVNESLECGVSD
jgi:predicted metalloprotease with PDZ domain